MIPQPLRTAQRPAQQSPTRMAPLAGIDLLSPLTVMKEGTARRLDDWICRPDGLHTRGGHDVVTEEHGGPITALMGYPGKVIATTATEIFEGQSAVVSGQSSGAWQGALLPNPGGLHLLCVNGANSPRHYDGLAWHTMAITGVDPTKLCAIVRHQRRIFMLERNSLRVWYLGIDAIGGPASPLHLEAQCTKGGSVMALASLEPNGGRGASAQLCIVTSEGELIVYGGTNPDRAAEWKLTGVWNVPKPRGKNAFANVGGQLALMTDKGVMPIPAVLAEKDSSKPTKSISVNIDPALASGTSHIVDSASAEMTILAGANHQWVRSETGAWSRLTLSTAPVWAEINGALYFGTTDGKVCRYGGDADNGAPIRAFAVDAFSTFKTPNTKQFHRVRSLYKAAHPYVPRIELLTNYRDPPGDFAAANIDDVYWQWSDISWPRQPMAWMRAVSSEIQNWRGLSAHGHAAALMKSVQTLTPIVWTGYEIIFTAGGRA